MQKLKSALMLGLLVVIPVNFVMAKDDLGQGRLFLGSTKADPTELKTELTAQNLKNIDAISQFGIEITFPTFQYLNLGLRYNRHYMSQDELVSDPSTDFKAEIIQDSMAGVARVPFLKTDFVHMDVFAGVGFSNTTYSEKVVVQDGQLEKKFSPYYTAGASMALGYKQYFLVFEGGYEGNKVEGFTRTGTINNNINTIDLSGSYFMVGLMFDGIPIFKK